MFHFLFSVSSSSSSSRGRNSSSHLHSSFSLYCPFSINHSYYWSTGIFYFHHINQHFLQYFRPFPFSDSWSVYSAWIWRTTNSSKGISFLIYFLWSLISPVHSIVIITIFYRLHDFVPIISTKSSELSTTNRIQPRTNWYWLNEKDEHRMGERMNGTRHWENKVIVSQQ